MYVYSISTGWLCQAEAPPGALFRGVRVAIVVLLIMLQRLLYTSLSLSGLSLSIYLSLSLSMYTYIYIYIYIHIHTFTFTYMTPFVRNQGMKQAVADGKSPPADIAFYFVHWFSGHP